MFSEDFDAQIKNKSKNFDFLFSITVYENAHLLYNYKIFILHILMYNSILCECLSSSLGIVYTLHIYAFCMLFYVFLI